MKLAARLIVEEALEEEVEDVIGRGYYAHGDGSRGHRNGYRRGNLDNAEGRIACAVPQVRGTLKPFQSAIREALGSRTEELERFAIEMYARGLSVRDIEVAFTDVGASDQRRIRQALRERAAERCRVLSGRLRSLHRASAPAHRPSKSTASAQGHYVHNNPQPCLLYWLGANPVNR